MERIARETYEGKIKPGELDEEHILLTYRELNKATGTGYGKDWLKVNNETGAPDPEVVKMQQNIFRFSEAKDAIMLQEINSLLTQGGKMSNWEDFKVAVLQLNQKYNVNYLQAEWQTARHAGYMANLWEEYKDNVSFFPNLEYRTQKDDRVRKEHENLHGIIKPLNDSFWDSYYPPNGWRCRCFVMQTAANPTPDEKMPTITPNDVKPEFRINVGKSGQVFKEGTENGGKPHPYFSLTKVSEIDYKKAFELMKLNAPYNTVYSKNAKVRHSIFADINDLPKNISLGTTVADYIGDSLDILPHLDRNIIPGKNPELFSVTNSIVGDRVSPEWKSIKNATENAFANKLSNKKGGQLTAEKNTFIAIELNFDATNENIEAFARASWQRFNHYTSLDFVYYYIENKNAVKIDRSEILLGYANYYNKIVALLK